MPQSKDPDSKKPIDTAPSPAAPPQDAAMPGALVLPVGGEVAAPDAATAAPVLPTGGISLDVGQDVINQLNDGTPAFGNVLSAIGNAIAVSQKGFDQAVIDTVNKLNGTNIDVVTEAIIELDDNGLPSADPNKTKLTKQSLSVLNFFTPVFHEWKNVSISMDLAVDSFHAEQAVSFKSHQESTNVSGGISWPFSGWFSIDHFSSDQSVQRNAEQNVMWTSGQCLVDAQLGPRRTGKFPVPAQFSVGPQVFITQGPITEEKTNDVVTARSAEMLIELRKATGEANPGKAVTVNASGLLPNFPSGAASDAAGRVKLSLKRNLSGANAGFRNFPVTVTLGSIQKPFSVTL